MRSLQARKGKSQVAVIAYPGENGNPTRRISGFTENIQRSEREKYSKLKAGGTTPTAAAICRRIRLMQNNQEDELQEEMIRDGGLSKENVI